MTKSINSPSDVVYQTIYHKTPKLLQDVIEKNNLGNIVNSFTNADGATPYLAAAEMGNVKMYDYLASLPNFEVSRVDNNGFNALFLATLRGKTEMFDHLVAHYKCDYRSTKRDGSDNIRPIDYAIKYGNKNMVEHLIANYPYSIGNYLISYAEKNGQQEIVDFLKEKAELNLKLSAEITDHNLAGFKKLCEENGAKPQSAGVNLAEFAALNDAVDIFEYLIEEHNFTNFDSTFLAKESLFKNDPKLLKSLLLKQNFDPEKQFHYEGKDYNLYQLSQARFKNAASQFLEEFKTTNERFIKAVEDGNQELTAELLNQNLIHKNTLNQAVLNSAAAGNLEIYQLLSQNKKLEADNKNVLRLVAASGNIDFVDYLTKQPEFSFEQDSKNKIFAQVIKDCPEDKKLGMLSYLVSQDIGFLFRDDYATHLAGSSKRLMHYSTDNKQVNDFLTATGANVRKILDGGLNQPSEKESINLFEALREFTENPYKVAKYSFKMAAPDSRFEYNGITSFLADREFKNLYSKLVTNEPELGLDYKKNVLTLYDVASEKKDFTFFEFVMSKFGNSDHLNKLHLLEKDEYLENLVRSGKIKPKQHSPEEIISCILPGEESLKRWKSKDPQVFYSFQLPLGRSEKTFSNAEQEFFNDVVSKAAKDLLVPVQEKKLSDEELRAVAENKFDKNIFFMLKEQIESNAQYATEKDGDKSTYKIIILPIEEILDREYSMLHQLAIGVGDLKHPSTYEDITRNNPDCGFGITTDDTLMSHICAPNSYSPDCFNMFSDKVIEGFATEIKLREADVKALTRSLVQQYPELSHKAVEFDNQREFCQSDERQLSADDLLLTTMLFGCVTLFLAKYIFRPGTSVTNANLVNQQQNNSLEL